MRKLMFLKSVLMELAIVNLCEFMIDYAINPDNNRLDYYLRLFVITTSIHHNKILDVTNVALQSLKNQS